MKAMEELVGYCLFSQNLSGVHVSLNNTWIILIIAFILLCCDAWISHDKVDLINLWLPINLNKYDAE